MIVWEKINDSTYRMKVPGGWVLRSEYYITEYRFEVPTAAVSVHQIFISDPNHGWSIKG